MSQKISELTAATDLALADEFPIVADSDGLNYRATVDQIRKALGQPLRFGQTLQQAGTSAPTVNNTLCNTMGLPVGIVWTRLDIGVYKASFSGITFPDPGKLTVIASAQQNPTGVPVDMPSAVVQFFVASETEILIITIDPTINLGGDNILNHYIEFQYYDYL
ncbi:MAG: hypothetical protein ACO1HP_07490 [Bacteroidota bacterium]